MSVKERIIVIRLLEKAGQHPDYAKALGIETSGENRLLNERKKRCLNY